MPNFLKLVGNSFVGLGVLAFVGAAVAADSPRSATNNSGRGRAGMVTTATTGRMPTLPTLPGHTVGNLPQELPSNGGNSTTPSTPDNPNIPDEPSTDDPTPPPAKPECPDGGVRNSDYTIERCMTDIQSCVNVSLPAGIASMYNEDLRNAIVNGMGLCQVQVEKCVAEVRRDCRNVYRSAADVWIDFNARRVQPEYYNFVLRKTGLTPNQAENTCRLLDKNTYGSSFNAVANSGATTAEYNQRVGAYNGQNGNVLIKKNPQGVQVNDGNPGVDGGRGHYARWDAATADCYIRVAAYNKDTHIKNSWLFGAAGDDQPAEVWRAAGDVFTCNKDLFGFSLMNKTATTAVVGVGGGTLLGAGVGAIAGHGKRAFDCSIAKHREMLLEELQDAGSVNRINNYLTTPLSNTDKALSIAECEDILDLYDRYVQSKQALSECGAFGVVTETLEVTATVENFQNAEAVASQIANSIADEFQGSSLNDEINGKCPKLPTLNLAAAAGRGVYSCSGTDSVCQPATIVARQVNTLDKILTADVRNLIEKGEKSNMAKSIGIGAAVGAGAGGIATGIVALVEHSNINCRLGDGLAQVGMGKSYSIGPLRDFYVKWNLNLPDTVSPTAQINDCQAWSNACAKFTNLEDCKNAQVNYKPTPTSTTTLIHSACAVSGSACIENYPVAVSYGVCE